VAVAECLDLNPAFWLAAESGHLGNSTAHYKLLGFVERINGRVLEFRTMANIPGPQPQVQFCPICKAELRNVPRSEMKSRGHKGKNGVSPDTHTYDCTKCKTRFEINQHR
jgi:uncharacterized protein with PIN domain